MNYKPELNDPDLSGSLLLNVILGGDDMLLKRLYDNYILEYSRVVIVLILLVITFLGYQARKLEIDASAETLMLENDKDLELTRLINSRYKSPNFLVVAYTPKGDLLADKTLNNLKSLKSDLLKLDRVKSVISILDVPLL